MKSAMRRTILVLVLGAGVAAGAAASAAAGAAARAADPLALDGHYWTKLAPDAREAFLAGFVAGAAAHQANGGVPGARGARTAAEAARLKRTGALAFPYAGNVYRSHLDDYFFYTNRRAQTLVEVLVDANAHFRAR